MIKFLAACRKNFGKAPRSFSFWKRLTYLRIPKPLWLRANPSDKLKTLFDHVDDLYSNGVVVWAHVVQANQLMFQAGSENCPGEVVYSLLDPRSIELETLQDVAQSLFSLKGTSPDDPNLFSIADYLTNERIRVFGLDVPSTISPQIPFKISTTFFVRKHLPGGKLSTPILPVIVSKNKPHVVLPLPQKYWPDELIDWWAR